MKLKIFLIFLVFIFLMNSCNIAFLVPKNKIVNVNQGYILIWANNQSVSFIPSKIDTSLSLTENLASHKLGKAFYLYGLFPSQLNYLKIFGDTISNGWVITPVEIKYIEIREVNRQLRKRKKEYQEHFIQMDDKIYTYQINIRNVLYISAYPILSEEKKRQKTKNHDEY